MIRLQRIIEPQSHLQGESVNSTYLNEKTLIRRWGNERN